MAVTERCRARVNRAITQVHELNSQVRAYLSRRPYEVIGERASSPDEIVLRLVVTEPSPLEWSVLVGEIIHDLRSTLDHLAWGLSELNSGSAPYPLPNSWRRIQFPICDTAAEFSREASNRLWALAPADVAAIEALQPYSGGQGTRLRFLRDLSNIDKHRTLHLLCAMLQAQQEYVRAVSAQDCELEAVDIVAAGPVIDGSVLGRVRLRLAGPRPRITVSENFIFDICLEDPSPLTPWRLDAVSALLALSFDVSDVVDNFASRFVSPGGSAL